MKIWLIHVGELLPIDGNVRLFRYGVLAEMLAEKGHHVTRWAPTFIHAHKRQRCLHDKTIQLSKHHSIELLYARGYSKNVSLNRVRFYYQLANVLKRRINEEPPPDIILSAIPTPGMCIVALRYAQKHKIPLVIDVRDLWPDIYMTAIPKQLRFLVRYFLWPISHKNRQLFRGASAIFGVTETYLNWGLGFAERERVQSDAVFPLGYPIPNFTAREIAEETRNLLNLGVDPNKIICCFFGQFEASYDLETVIKAARSLERSGCNNVQFVLCGEGAKLNVLRNQAADLRNVLFPGWVPGSTIQALMRMSKIGLVTYVNGAMQSLPNKAIEYLAGGLSIVSSLHGELEKMIEDENCGVTYEAHGMHSLVCAIRSLAENPDGLRCMRGKAKELFEKQFTASRVYLPMIDKLDKIASGKLKTAAVVHQDG